MHKIFQSRCAIGNQRNNYQDTNWNKRLINFNLQLIHMCNEKNYYSVRNAVDKSERTEYLNMLVNSLMIHVYCIWPEVVLVRPLEKCGA